MKLNIFKIPIENKETLIEDLEEKKYECLSTAEYEGFTQEFYFYTKDTDNKSWITYYRDIIGEDFDEIIDDIAGQNIAGVFLIYNTELCYAVSHGQTHFYIRKYCNKDFGLDLAERICDPSGLKMKHSETFSSKRKKDITSFSKEVKLENSFDYGEAFSYVKCKTKDKKIWGNQIDFGESARLTIGEQNYYSAENLHNLIRLIENKLNEEAVIRLPRYTKVTNNEIKDELNKKMNEKYLEFIADAVTDDYWLTGVSFNFGDSYRYAIKFNRTLISDIVEDLPAEFIRRVLEENDQTIKGKYEKVKVAFIDETDTESHTANLKDLMQVSIEYQGRYYVLYNNNWVEFSESYVTYIENQVDDINFEIKKAAHIDEDDLINHMCTNHNYIKLHKKMVYVGRYSIEKADLMDENDVIMIKSQKKTEDLVYLVKQATTSLRLAKAGEIGENVFKGRNVCLWMIVTRKSLSKLSDFKSFHLLDALNDFKIECRNKELTPVIWITLGS